MSKDILKLKSDAIDATISARRLEEKELGDLVEKIKGHMNFLMLHVDSGTLWHKKMMNDEKRDCLEHLRLWRLSVDREAKQISDFINGINRMIAGIDHKKLSDIAGALAQIHSLSSSPIYSAILKAVEKNT